MTSRTGNAVGAGLDAAANQVVPLGLQELVQQGGCDRPELLLQSGRVAAAEGETPVRPRPHCHDNQ